MGNYTKQLKKGYRPIPIIKPPPVKIGSATLTVPRGGLWPDLEANPNIDLSRVDRNASGLEYLSIWKSECEARWQDTTFDATLAVGDHLATVDTSINHPYGEMLAKSAMRLGMQLYLQHDRWLVHRGTERHRYWLMKFGEPIPKEDAYADDLPGEAGDSPEDGSGQPAADGQVSPATRDAGAQE